ncbi:type VII secretion protein EsaA [Virgibacillus massiliensis]|nr:type VII secretion protein EsaA [Virgibacillus massiliensis]
MILKSIDKRWILFLTLIILLASGLTFLALNQEASSKKEENRDPKMAVALVNEDEGAVFNGEDLAFGDAFVKSMDKNNNHDWYIVSRGVAESGLTNNTYDMMIVIPNNFSQKALSIESENPEQVVLDYKINATDNEKIKAEAEKTASNILNEFNQRIIDVFFASILNNLQGAQTNIGDIIDKQSQLTNTYNNQIYGRLNNYTDQFGMIKDNTEISKDSFSGFEDKLENYENELAEDAERNQNYLSSLEEVFQMQETNTTTWQNFYEAFNQFDTTLNASEVEGQLQELQAANLAINKQFQTREEQPKTPSVNTVMFRQSSNNVANIASGTAALKKHLDESLTKVEQTNADIDETLNSLDADVKKKLEGLLGDEGDQTLSKLLNTHHTYLTDKIQSQVSLLPSLEIGDFEKMDLSTDTLREIENVIKVTKLTPFEIPSNETSDFKHEIIADHIKEVTEHWKNNGVTITDTVNIEEVENKENGQTFTLNNIPKNFTLQTLELKLPGEDRFEEYEGPTVNFDKPIHGDFSVRITLTFNGGDIDIYQPIRWGWVLEQENINNADMPKTTMTKKQEAPLVASMKVENSIDKQGKEENVDNEDTNAKGKATEEEQKQDKLPEDESESNKNKEDQDINKEEKRGSTDDDSELDQGDQQGRSSSKDDSVKEEDSNFETEIETIEVENKIINRTVISSTDKMDDTTKTLINGALNYISPYQKLYSSYESYYGIEMDGPLIDNLDPNSELKDIATEDSLYYLFNEENINGLIVDQIADGITQEIQKPLQTLKSQIDDHQQRVQQAYQNADQLVKKVEATSKKAKDLNTNLASTLEDVSKWRERSQTLIEQQTEIQANEDGENTAIMSLGNEFEPLLTASQSLAEQSQGNLNAAENVYDTFDTIDNHAETIQESGVNLVDQAEELSVNMTNKLVEDQEFANNFTNVLANSQIGERENENLYEFLSNPVQVSNNGTITSPTGNTFNPYYLVLICFIVVLFTAYVISTINQKRVEQDQFTEEKSLMAANTPITMITAGIGVLEGIIIGVLSSYFLEISNVNMLLWITVVTTVTVAMLLIATYLLRQLKMIGMFLLLAIFSIYLFLTNTLGSGSEAIQMIREFSPLKLVESVLRNTVQGDMNYSVTLAIIIGLIVLGAVGNLFVTYQLRNKGDIDDESSEEAS